MNAVELARAMLEAKSEIDHALREYEERIHADAEADKLFKIAHATAYLSASGTVPEREAQADKQSAGERYAAKMADGLKRSAASAVDAKKGWLSALQSIAANNRAEAELTRWQPREVE